MADPRKEAVRQRFHRRAGERVMRRCGRGGDEPRKGDAAFHRWSPFGLKRGFRGEAQAMTRAAASRSTPPVCSSSTPAGARARLVSWLAGRCAGVPFPACPGRASASGVGRALSAYSRGGGCGFGPLRVIPHRIPISSPGASAPAGEPCPPFMRLREGGGQAAIAWRRSRRVRGAGAAACAGRAHATSGALFRGSIKMVTRR